MSLLMVHSRYPILISMVGVGIAWAGILSLPYSLLADELPKNKGGIFMGLFNGFVTLPQIVMSLGFGWVMKTVLQENRLWALSLGGLFLGAAALLMLRVPEPASASVEINATPENALSPANNP
jgi:maltose/moltooligosaccharide transporter